MVPVERVNKGTNDGPFCTSGALGTEGALYPGGKSEPVNVFPAPDGGGGGGTEDRGRVMIAGGGGGAGRGAVSTATVG